MNRLQKPDGGMGEQPAAAGAGMRRTSVAAAEGRAGSSIATHCCFCSMQCGMQVASAPESGHGWIIRPSPDFPVATGRLCQKGLNALEHVVHRERLTAPLRRPDGAAGWKQESWEDALDGIAAQLERIQSSYGRDAVGVYGGGSLTNEVSYLLGKFARVALRTRYIDYNGRYCMSSAAAAQHQAFGIDRYILLAGTNIAECQPAMTPYLLAAKKNGAVIVAIDPRNTMTSKLADIHVRLQPCFDSVFVNGLLHVIIREKLYDKTFVENRTNGFAELAAAAGGGGNADEPRRARVPSAPRI